MRLIIEKLRVLCLCLARTLKCHAVKRFRSPNEMQAQQVARKRAGWMFFIGAIVGAVVLFLSSDFLALHCATLIALAFAGGLNTARSVISIEPASARAAGSSGGVYTALGYVLPFLFFSAYRWITLNENEFAKRVSSLTPQQLDFYNRFNIEPSLQGFATQDASFFFGYLIFACLFGWLFGMFAGAMSRRA